MVHADDQTFVFLLREYLQKEMLECRIYILDTTGSKVFCILL